MCLLSRRYFDSQQWAHGRRGSATARDVISYRFNPTAEVPGHGPTRFALSPLSTPLCHHRLAAGTREGGRAAFADRVECSIARRRTRSGPPGRSRTCSTPYSVVVARLEVPRTRCIIQKLAVVGVINSGSRLGPRGVTSVVRGRLPAWFAASGNGAARM